MVDKKFCDFCGKDISEGYEIEIFDETSEKYILNKDACESCKVKLKKVIENEVKRA